MITRTTIVAALAALAVAALSACGGEDAKLLPGETAREITANLDSVQQLSEEGDCVGAESAASQVSEQIEGLGGVDRRLKEALREGAERLNEVVDECEEAEEAPEAVAPAEIPPKEEEREPDEAAEKKEEKEREKAAKEREKEERSEEEEEAPAGEHGPPEAPPGQTTPPGPEEAPSGGVEPGSPAEGQQGEG